jgi:putative intracellular protease/amidase
MIGSNGTTVRPDVALPIENVDDYDALIFVGGAIEFLNDYIADPDINRLIQTALEKGKVIAAICGAIGILIEADILDGKQATIFDPEKECKKIEDVGAICTGAFTQRDGSVITSQGPHSALSFGRVIGEALLEP